MRRVGPLAHASGFGLDEVIVFGTVVASYVVYRFARGPRPDDDRPSDSSRSGSRGRNDGPRA
jgi:hypothetical protein